MLRRVRRVVVVELMNSFDVVKSIEIRRSGLTRFSGVVTIAPT